MEIAVFGLGYVGVVSAACMARQGHRVVGVDVNPLKVDVINSGRSPIVEPEVESIISESVEAGRLSATSDYNESVHMSSLSMVCVGTPSQRNGNIDLSYVLRVCEQIGTSLRGSSSDHVVVIRSTVLPGTTERYFIPALEKSSGRKIGAGLDIVFNPEFLREGSSIKDFYSPPFTIVGGNTAEGAATAASLYEGIDAPVYKTSINTAEVVKYSCNAFHGLKVAFANEIGSICKGVGVDSHEAMEIFCSDRKLNISPAYLKPGFAFGGSCLPKDLRALCYRAKQLDVDTPLLNSILPSNRTHTERAVEMVLSRKGKNIGIIGLSFKPGTDDLRESPMVAVVEQLIGKGFNVLIYDPNVSQAGLIGSNRQFIEQHIPHIWALMRNSVDEVIRHGDTVVLGAPLVEAGQLSETSAVIDVARVFGSPVGTDYEGLCW